MKCLQLVAQYLLLLIVLLRFSSTFVSGGELLLSKEEISRVLSHGPWPLKKSPDPSNRVSANPSAITLGKIFFNSKKLSSDLETSCATCHRPAENFIDGLARGQGLEILDRNTPALFNLKYNRWFSWDGTNDNLWAQSIIPIRHPKEMAMSADQVTKVLLADPFAKPYASLFGPPRELDDVQNLVNVGKALAAYQETLVTGLTRFDQFRDALKAGDWSSAADYPASAQRGLSIFIGKGRCNFCHTGPLFSNGEFHDAGVPYFIEPGLVDSGRHGGIKNLKNSLFTLDGKYSDDQTRSGAWAVRGVIRQHADFGKFRVPSLRNVAKTAPYMHNGSLATLEDVVKHYSNIDVERLHADGESILRPLKLNDMEINDLANFLETLSSNNPDF
jgi:cytochrome c peroxidase